MSPTSVAQIQREPGASALASALSVAVASSPSSGPTVADARSRLVSRIRNAVRCARFDDRVDEWEQVLARQPRRIDA